MAEDDDAGNVEHRPDLGGRPAGDERDDRAPRGEPRQQVARTCDRASGVRTRRDLGERAVEVEEDAGSRETTAQGVQRAGRVRTPLRGCGRRHADQVDDDVAMSAPTITESCTGAEKRLPAGLTCAPDR